MEEWNGFRICIELCIPEIVESKKCFIFIDKKWTKIKHVQDHIRNVFDIVEDVNLFIEDVLLPENETIQLIQYDDILVVKPQMKKKLFARKQTYQMWIPLQNQRFPDLNVKTKIDEPKVLPCLKKEDTADIMLSNCLKELRSKREQIEKRSTFVEPLKPLEPPATENHVDEALLDVSSIKKRKRKHKKKKKFEENSYEENSKNSSDLITFDSSEASSKHIHFTDDFDLNAHSSSKDTVSTVDEVRSKFIELVKKSSSEKTFSRKSEITPKTSEAVEVTQPVNKNAHIKENETEDDSNFSDVVLPKVGNLIAFKKIKLGSDYTPQKSNEILGEVMDIKECDGSRLIVFKISEGFEEFEIPSGKFSMELDEDNVSEKNSDKICVAELHWHEVLSPRLVKKL